MARLVVSLAGRKAVNGYKNPELTVCQMRLAANAAIQARCMPPRQVRALFEKVSSQIRYYQRRNSQAHRSHRKRTIRKLYRLGITLTSLRRCDTG